MLDHLPKVHLGCGKRFLPGYIHVDVSDYSHVDFKTDVTSLEMFANESIGLIYASHVLEYFDRTEVVSVLKEWHRVLHPKGILRIAVPDFHKLIKVYEDSGDLDRVVGPLYGRWEILPNRFIYHKTVYDYSSLYKILTNSGFHDIEYWDWSKVFTGIHAGFDDYSQAYYPHMDKENGLLISLNVQGVK